jgi:TPR repeat protein
VVSLTSITLLIAPLAAHAQTHALAQGSKAEGMRAWRRGDHASAMHVLRPFAEAGEPDAQNAIGEMLLSPNAGAPIREAEAAAWFRKAAFQGFPRAQVNLGCLLEQGGRIGMKKEAARWYHCAAVQGFAAGQHHLARVHESGEGVPRDLPKAVYWYTMAVHQHYAPSQFALGLMRHNGIGLPRNPADAMRWYRKAAAQNLPEAIQVLEEIRSAGLGDARQTRNAR